MRRNVDCFLASQIKVANFVLCSQQGSLQVREQCSLINLVSGFGNELIFLKARKSCKSNHCLLADIPQCTAPKKGKVLQSSPQILKKCQSDAFWQKKCETLVESHMILLTHSPLPQDNSPKSSSYFNCQEESWPSVMQGTMEWGQGCDAKCLTCFPGEKRKTTTKNLTYSVCQFPDYKYTHHC